MDYRPAEKLNAGVGIAPLALPISKLTPVGIQRLCDFLHFESGVEFKPLSTNSDGTINAIISVNPIRSTSAGYIAFSKKVAAGTLIARHIGQYEAWANVRTDFSFDKECVVIDSVSGRMMGLPHLDPLQHDTGHDQALAYARRRRPDQRPD